MALYKKYRPKSLGHFAGNEQLKADLQPFLKKTRPFPSAMLITGASGGGKTTLARILARYAGISSTDLNEMDTADFRGIDAMRDIRRQMYQAPIGGGARGWILDECFAAGTPVSTPAGPRPIESLDIGDKIFSAVGVDEITKVYATKTPFERLCQVFCDIGESHLPPIKPILTTIDHEFFTTRGWVEAKNLRAGDVLFRLKTGASKHLLHLLHDQLERTAWRGLVNAGGSKLRPSEWNIAPTEGAAFERVTVQAVNFYWSDWNYFIPEKVDGYYATMYDLEEKKHHSYFAGGVLVHNCHMLTNEAQNALLKSLESEVSDVYFWLCTTDPQKLLKTIHTRCTQFTVESLSNSDLVQVLQRVCSGEQVDIPKDVLQTLVRQAGGSARAAISALERILGRDPDDYDKAIETFQQTEAQVIELCQALLARKKWSAIAAIAQNIKEEPEKVRRAIIMYAAKVLLSGKDSAQAAVIIDAFREPYFNTGEAGLALSCYQASLSE